MITAPMLLDLLTALLWTTTALAALNVAFQIIDLHTTSELIKRNAAQEATAWMARHLNNASVPWARRFWALAAVKLLCAAAVILIAVIAWQLPVHYSPVFFALEAALAWQYGRQMRLNWALYKKL